MILKARQAVGLPLRSCFIRYRSPRPCPWLPALPSGWHSCILQADVTHAVPGRSDGALQAATLLQSKVRNCVI